MRLFANEVSVLRKFVVRKFVVRKSANEVSVARKFVVRNIAERSEATTGKKGLTVEGWDTLQPPA